MNHLDRTSFVTCLYRLQTKGGSFTGDDKDYLKVRLGSNQVIPAFEEALRGMKVGGIRRIVVPEVCRMIHGLLRILQNRCQGQALQASHLLR